MGGEDNREIDGKKDVKNTGEKIEWNTHGENKWGKKNTGRQWMLCCCVHLCALMNRLCGSSVRWLCWRSRTSSCDLSSLSASWHTSFQPASSFLRLPLDISLQHTNNTAQPLCVYCKSVRVNSVSPWWRHRTVFCAPLCYSNHFPLRHDKFNLYWVMTG